ncbi:MAG: acyl-CoA dehydratase activase [Candidatus Nomurabacteria bacterium]|jgi:predicted CoA-substrate-specific enzyme activase|nr:acyl-CoA dehydratase activase [Candidatus Nomurabacteria bacterium]
MDSVRAGIDIGSTTIKCVVLGKNNELLHAVYERHNSDIAETVLGMMRDVAEKFGNNPIKATMTGSGAMNMARLLELKHVQEVKAMSKAVREFIPDADAMVELGGEDAKCIVLLPNGSERMRMNDSCAGGTGAFIDQMATLLKTNADNLNEIAKTAEKPARISSRCGVFAKSDIQPLLNSDEPLGNIAAGIYRAIANQTIGQLAQGDLKAGQHIVLLGGPLCFSSELRRAFETHERLAGASFSCPESAEFFVAIGAALAAEDEAQTTFGILCKKLEELPSDESALDYLPPLFESCEALQKFREENPKTFEDEASMALSSNMFLGIDRGSTTGKAVVIDESGKIVWSSYEYNSGDVTAFANKISRVIYERDFQIRHSVAIGYGEEVLIKHGIAQSGEVETMAHLRAALELYGDVDYVIDVGGQDVKVFAFQDEQLRDVQLNEACSSGCGSFLKTYADSLGFTPEEFDELACTAEHPIDLGTRCTVFMGSNVKNAQRHGAELADIAAGLQYSVVKNLLYKVVKSNLSGRIVAQGGTLWNDGVYRALQIMTGAEVMRPKISGLMGAYGAALLARDRAAGAKWHEGKPIDANLVKFKLDLLLDRPREEQSETLFDWDDRGEIGIPLALGMFEDYPYWYAFFDALGFRVIPSSLSNSGTYERGISSIFSGTVCYPAKLLHGHIVDLVEKGVKRIWMPFIKWEVSEDRDANNHYNCPVVMGYPYAVESNMAEYLRKNGVQMYTMPLPFDKPRRMVKVLAEMDLFGGLRVDRLRSAMRRAIEAQRCFQMAIRLKGEIMLKEARASGKHVFVLAGHPYHIDPEVNHGIAELVNKLGVVVLTEDSVAHLTRSGKTRASNQWMYHARLYRAAKFVATQENVDLVQLVSFGCGLDAVTAIEVQGILEKAGKPYTQLKLDDISGTRPARIRLRSLLALLATRG